MSNFIQTRLPTGVRWYQIGQEMHLAQDEECDTLCGVECNPTHINAFGRSIPHPDNVPTPRGVCRPCNVAGWALTEEVS